MESTDILIVGAGPAGSYLAERLASSGLKVTLVDKKKIIGKQACSGLISRRLSGFVKIKKEFLLNKVRSSIFHSQNYSFPVGKSSYLAYVIDRPKFDNYLLSSAIDSGAVFKNSTAFLSYGLKNNIVLASTTEGKIKAGLIVGADGAASAVRRASQLKGDLHFVNGVISYFSSKDTPGNSDTVDVYYNKIYSPDFFAWKIPRGNSFELGLASGKNHMAFFGKFIAYFGLKMPHKLYSHPICYGVQDTASDNLILLGDAAAQVKPFSGGGIIYSLISARIASKAIISAFETNNFSKEYLNEIYDLRWKEKLLEKIEIGLGVRNTLNSLSNSELDAFFSTLSENKTNLEKIGDMDFL